MQNNMSKITAERIESVFDTFVVNKLVEELSTVKSEFSPPKNTSYKGDSMRGLTEKIGSSVGELSDNVCSIKNAILFLDENSDNNIVSILRNIDEINTTVENIKDSAENIEEATESIKENTEATLKALDALPEIIKQNTDELKEAILAYGEERRAEAEKANAENRMLLDTIEAKNSLLEEANKKLEEQNAFIRKLQYIAIAVSASSLLGVVINLIISL